jgi:hypothetical protein
MAAQGVPADDIDGGISACTHAQMRKGAEIPKGKGGGYKGMRGEW